MSAVAEMVSNYAEIRRRLRNLPPPVKVTAPRLVPASKPAPTIPALPSWVGQPIPPYELTYGPVAHRPDHWKPSPTVHEIIKAACLHFGISRTELLSERRTADVVYSRHVAMYVAKKITLRSLPYIGLRFNGRDHTTVLSAVRKMAARIANGEASVIDDVQAIKKYLGVADD